jgi:hypothetical protein
MWNKFVSTNFSAIALGQPFQLAHDPHRLRQMTEGRHDSSI